MQTNNHLSVNPYFFGKPIYEYNNLFGRNDILQRIKEHITEKDIKITLLHVQRRIGKTSLITCLPDFFTKEENIFKFAYFSFQGYKASSPPQILQSLARDIVDNIDVIPPQVIELANNSYNFFNLFFANDY